jgi:hypothetical protein
MIRIRNFSDVGSGSKINVQDQQHCSQSPYILCSRVWRCSGGCGVAQLLVHRAAERNPRVHAGGTGTLPSAQQDELFTQTHGFITSSG